SSVGGSDWRAATGPPTSPSEPRSTVSCGVTRGCDPVGTRGCDPVGTRGCEPVCTLGYRPVVTRGCDPVTCGWVPLRRRGCDPVGARGCPGGFGFPSGGSSFATIESNPLGSLAL